MRALLFTILFWIFTYAILTYRAQMVYDDAFSLASTRRLVSVTAGSTCFWLVLSRILATGGRISAHPLLAIGTILPASILVLATRLSLDWALAADPIPLEDNLRWVLVWSGYFGLWLSAFLALEMHRRATNALVREYPSRPVGEASIRTPPTGAASASDKTIPTASWEWVLDALASEMAHLQPGQRQELLQHLRAKAGYELADSEHPLAEAHNARVQLVAGLTDRLEKNGRR